MSDLHFFDPRDDVSKFERRLPHWAQSGVVCFVTWRTIDSIPKAVLRSWQAARTSWLRKHGIDPVHANWKVHLQRLGRDVNEAFYRQFSARWHDELDSCHGKCLMGHPAVSEIVANALHFGDGSKFDLMDFVIMPNHVHFIAAFPLEDEMLSNCTSIKHYSARQINSLLERKGKFWQQDGFDHLIR